MEDLYARLEEGFGLRGMAAWMWMRYSYAWEVSVEDMSRVRGETAWPVGAFVRLSGVAFNGPMKADTIRADGQPGCEFVSARVIGELPMCIVAGLSDMQLACLPTEAEWEMLAGSSITITGRARWTRVKKTRQFKAGRAAGLQHATDNPDSGRRRATIITGGSSVVYMDCAVYADASRFHGGSVAGLVVGAMGCFIFGLYLRGWLRERKVLARQPGQDMIA